jgi:uncharacterized protein
VRAGGSLEVELADTLGQPRRLQVELATTTEARAAGLMFRRSLEPHDGMLFVFPETRPVKMWMRNTFLPLDMLFLSESGEILSVHPACEPLSERRIGPELPVRAVLELPAGQAAKLSLVPGSRLQHPHLLDLEAR